MNLNQARQQAAAASKTGGVHFVVWLEDDARRVLDAKQFAFWQHFAFVEAIYVSGCEVANCVRGAA